MTDQSSICKFCTQTDCPSRGTHANACTNFVTNPSPAAMRAARAILETANNEYRSKFPVDYLARIIDRETGVAELRAALEAAESALNGASCTCNDDRDCQRCHAWRKVRAALGKD